jgi:hypothetical protein
VIAVRPIKCLDFCYIYTFCQTWGITGTFILGFAVCKLCPTCRSLSSILFIDLAGEAATREKTTNKMATRQVVRMAAEMTGNDVIRKVWRYNIGKENI